MLEERGLYPAMRVLEQLEYLARLHALTAARARAAARSLRHSEPDGCRKRPRRRTYRRSLPWLSPPGPDVAGQVAFQRRADRRRKVIHACRGDRAKRQHISGQRETEHLARGEGSAELQGRLTGACGRRGARTNRGARTARSARIARSAGRLAPVDGSRRGTVTGPITGPVTGRGRGDRPEDRLGD